MTVTQTRPHETPEARVKRIARDVGFDLVGIAEALPHDRSNRILDRWLRAEHHGEMTWLERHQSRRDDPRSLLPSARSIISVGVNYYQEVERAQRSADGADGRGAFSIYVHHEDYHTVLGRMLDDLAERLCEAYPGMKSLACVDTRAISDRAAALRAGVGWVGKNTAVISPEFGSWIFLGELLVDVELEPDTPLSTLCASCTKCIDACPTGALDTPFVLDANRCISYLTIEKRGEIPNELSQRVGADVYGCDTCQSVCPFNDVATPSRVFKPETRSPIVDMPISRLEHISDATFRELTEGSAIRRCGADGMRRNARVVRENVEAGRVPASPRQSAGR